MFKIDKKSSLPIYQQLIYNIKKAISSGVLLENEKVPSENSLCAIYDISRTTVRQALETLEKEGYIYKIKGKGSYISPTKIYQNRSAFSKFYDDMMNLGKVPKSRIISLKVKIPSQSIQDEMKLEDGKYICELIWVRYGDGEALIYETVNLNYEFVKGIEKENLQEAKLYDLIIQKYKVNLTHGNEQILPCKLTEIEARYLESQEGELGMKVRRTVYQGTKIIEYTKSTVRGDKFVYTVNF